MEPVQDKIIDPALREVLDKLRAGARLGFDDGMRLFDTEDFLGLGVLANQAKEEHTGDEAYFVINQQINPSNLCVLSCKFCEFAAKRGDAKAYEMTMEEMLARCGGDVSEVHIVGGLHPDWPFEFYLDIVREIRSRFPRIQIKAYTAVEVDYFSRIAKIPIEGVLEKLREAGMNTMPGGGAEVFSERVRKELFPQKIGAEPWLRIHRLAHRMGIRSNATLLYGHIETREERVAHMLRLRELQDETRGFLSFIPLAFQVGNTGIVERPASAMEDLRTIAVSRLLLDNFTHIKAYWVMLGLDVTPMALNFGADDLDGTIGKETIAHMAGAESPAGLTRSYIVNMIRQAGRVPVVRDGLYNRLEVLS